MITDPVRFSNLKHIARSPMHYHHAVTVGRDDKPWLRGGRGLHCVLFEQPYVVFDGGARRGKEWEKFCADTFFADAVHLLEPEIILAKELPVYEAQAQAIRAELKRQDLSHLLDGDVEKRIEWEWLGRRCAGTPDVQNFSEWRRPRTVDVKTTCNADPRRFVWDARKFCYAEQVTWYGNGGTIASGRHRDDQYFEDYIIAVEKTAPYPVVIWQVTEAKRLEAEKTLRLWFEQLLACEASDSWPGYAQCVQQLDVVDSEGITLTIGDEEVEVE